MRHILPIAAAALLAGCMARAPEQPQTVPQPPPAQTPQIRSDLIGLTAGELIQRFGQPALQVREGAGLKLQLRGRSCVLDAYLYPPGQGAERVTHVDTRLRERQRDRSAGLHRVADPVLKPAHRPGGRLGDHRVGIGEVSATTGASFGSPLFPAAIRQLRIIRLRPMRLIGEPANISRNAASSSASRSASCGAASSARGRKARLAAAASAKRFHGQTARQSSQP